MANCYLWGQGGDAAFSGQAVVPAVTTKTLSGTICTEYKTTGLAFRPRAVVAMQESAGELPVMSTSTVYLRIDFDEDGSATESKLFALNYLNDVINILSNSNYLATGANAPHASADGFTIAISRNYNMANNTVWHVYGV